MVAQYISHWKLGYFIVDLYFTITVVISIYEFISNGELRAGVSCCVKALSLFNLDCAWSHFNFSLNYKNIRIFSLYSINFWMKLTRWSMQSIYFGQHVTMSIVLLVCDIYYESFARLWNPSLGFEKTRIFLFIAPSFKSKNQQI